MDDPTPFKRKYVHRLKCSRGHFVYMYRRGKDRIRIGLSTDAIECLEASYARIEAGWIDLRLRGSGRSGLNPVLRMARTSALRAKKLERSHNLTGEDIWRILEGQNFRCALSGIPLTTSVEKRGPANPFAASIDRLDNTKGYTTENVRIVCVIANMARNVFSDEDFYKMCDSAAKWQKYKRRT
jgi:hypothetical protein